MTPKKCMVKSEAGNLGNQKEVRYNVLLGTVTRHLVVKVILNCDKGGTVKGISDDVLSDVSLLDTSLDKNLRQPVLVTVTQESAEGSENIVIEIDLGLCGTDSTEVRVPDFGFETSYADEDQKIEFLKAKEKSPEAASFLTGVIKKLLLIISRPARLLECLEFDPEEFYLLLEQAEGQAKISQGIKADLPQYIINKLGLNRDPIAEATVSASPGVSRTERIVFGRSLFHVGIDWAGRLTPLSWGRTLMQLAKAEQDDCKLQEDINQLERSCSYPEKLNLAVSKSSALEEDKESKLPTEDDFEIVKLISNGAYGAVYLVRRKDTRARFAMKKITKNNLMLRNQVEQVFAERDIMSFTDNPFVVSMYCSFETKKHLCLVMEYVEGGDCATLVKNIGPLPPDMARFYFAETVLAVEYLHSYGIVHRDLKPDNLLITALGHIKLTDFGLSKMGLMSLATNLYEGYIDRETRQFSDKQVFGTPEYIAPEVILRQGYGKPVDWWSMGIILYEFLIGCVPFFGETPEELFAHTVNDDIEWPDDDDWPIQAEAKDIITALLQQNARDRLGTGGAHEVKEHPYFFGVDWTSLLRQKAEFVPQIDHEEDTSYFDTRMDRYNHDIGEDTDDTDESPLFASFSSCSPQYRKVQNRLGLYEELDESSFRKSFSRGDSGQSDHSESSPSNLGSTLDTPDVDGMKELVESGDNNSQKITGHPSTPESSQTESDDVSPQIQRKRRLHSKEALPRFSISMEDNQTCTPPVPSCVKHRSRAVIKSASASGLSLVIPSDDVVPQPIQSPGGSSTASSRDTSPCRELSPLVTSLKPPIIIRRGPRGFGFTVHTIRVYYGDTDFYTMHHLVMAVDDGSPAFESGVRPGDLITHINGEAVQGLYHTQVLQLLLSGGDHVTLRSTPLENTSIRTGGRKREPWQSKLARRSMHRQRRQKRDHPDKRRKPSLFRRISSKRASVELQQPMKLSCPLSAPVIPADCKPQFMMAASVSSPSMVTPSRSFQSLSRSVPSQETILGSPTHTISLRSPPTNRIAFSSPELSHSPGNSSQSSSPSSSAPNSPAGAPATSTVHYQRPSTLHGLKHKLHSAAKSIHSPSRRKSVGHIPLSPLARTPSPSPLPSSPTRSPSPLAFPAGHQPGSSNTTQSYSPGTSLTTPGSGNKKGFGRPKSAEPGSPLLRRALSPDRLHPRSAESKVKPTSTSISPLCNPALKVTVSAAPRVTITSQSPPVPSRPPTEYGTPVDQVVTSKPPEHPLLVRSGRELPVEKLIAYTDQRSERRERKSGADSNHLSHQGTVASQDHILHCTPIGSSDFVKLEHRNALGSAAANPIVPGDRTTQHLPRIAEEKDSPTSTKEEVLKAVQNVPTSSQTMLKDQEPKQKSNINKSLDNSCKKYKSDVGKQEVQKGKQQDVKSDISKTKTYDTKAVKGSVEDKVLAQSKSDMRNRKKDSAAESSSGVKDKSKEKETKGPCDLAGVGRDGHVGKSLSRTTPAKDN